MKIKTQTITISDPREFDGDPYQVAERALGQAQALALLLEQAVEAAEIMSRNAELERTLATGDKDTDLSPIAKAWPQSPQGRTFHRVHTALPSIQVALGSLKRAAAFNPKSRIRT
jgi:GrpB-like predicted nucleotidyltransferase (UPF0157 family)